MQNSSVWHSAVVPLNTLSPLNALGVNTVFHYVPLHSSPFGVDHSRVNGDIVNTTSISERLVRLPLWLGLEEQQAEVIQTIVTALE